MIDWIKSALFVCAIVGLPIFGIHSRQQSEWRRAGGRAIAERERRESTLHVVREADGCKVYAQSPGALPLFHPVRLNNNDQQQMGVMQHIRKGALVQARARRDRGAK